MTLTPATIVKALTTGYPLPRPTERDVWGALCHAVAQPVVVDSVEHFGRLRQTGEGRVRLVWRGPNGWTSSRSRRPKR